MSSFLGEYNMSGTVFGESVIERGYSSVETSGSLTRRWVVSAGKHRPAKHGPLVTPIVKGHPHRAEIYSQGMVSPPASAQSILIVVCPRFGGLFRGTWSHGFDSCESQDLRDRRCIQFPLEIVHPAASIRFGDYHTAQMA